jgi:hypothetical protein
MDYVWIGHYSLANSNKNINISRLMEIGGKFELESKPPNSKLE